MRVLELDASNWKTILDFMDELCVVLESPKSHGRSIDAFLDSMVWEGMKQITPPYTIRIINTQKLAENVRQKIDLLAVCIIEARAEHRKRDGIDVDVNMEIFS